MTGSMTVATTLPPTGRVPAVKSSSADTAKAGVDYVDRSVFVADRFHLMKYINRVSRLVLDDEKWVNEAVNEFLIDNRHEVLLNPFLGLTMFTEFISRKIKEEAK